MNDSVVCISPQTISLIEKELQPIDVISLIFLLYDDHRAAFVEVAVLEREGACYSPLSTWAQAQQGDIWKCKFIEALNICQLNSVLRKLGLNYSSDIGIIVFNYLDPIKLRLYNICENMNNIDIQELKQVLNWHQTPMYEYESCELIILKLLCDGFIVIERDSYNIELRLGGSSLHLTNIPFDLLDLRNKFLFIPAASSADDKYKSVEKENGNDGEDVLMSVDEVKSDKRLNDNSPSDDLQKIADLDKYGMHVNVGSDSQVGHPSYIHNILNPQQDVYPIKDPERLGIALIINLVTFQAENDNVVLKDRDGCVADTKLISDTMIQLKFKVMAILNTTYSNMLGSIKEVIKKYVDVKNDSIFSMFVLSHGGHGHVYSSDCFAVRIEDIKKTICDALNEIGLPDIPKLLMINACQVSDGVLKNFSKIRVTDFITCYSTTPGLESYKLPANAPVQGAIYPKVFCTTLLEHKDSLDMLHILNKINKKMKETFNNAKDKDKQMSFSENTTTRILYFKRFANNTPM